MYLRAPSATWATPLSTRSAPAQLDVQQRPFDAELGLTQAKGGLFQALINLYKAMGGGWVDTLAGKPAE